MRVLIIRFFILFAGYIFLPAALSFAATVTYPQQFSTGWNLAGNSLATAIDVKATLGAQANIQTVWKWDAINAKWAFYSPALDTTQTLTGYAATKGYNVLTTINPGEGYWVNASAQVSIGTQSGTGFSLAASHLVTGWNLAATADDIAPATFTTIVGNVTTQWAWDNAHSAWYFYAPSLAANNTLASYIVTKGYKNFGTLNLGNGLGFWVNYAGAGIAAAPTASVVSIGGNTNVGQTLTGSYTYVDANNDPQGASTFRWLRNGTAIAGATASTYTLAAADLGTAITFEVTPVATVAPTTGTPAVSGATANIADVVAAAPTASAVSINGIASVGQTLTGSYTYADANSDP